MKLFYFTSSYPYGLGEQWKLNELNELVPRFESVTVIPFSYGDNFHNPKTLRPGLKLAGPLFRSAGKPIKKSDLFRVLLHRRAFLFVREFFAKRVFLDRQRLVSWLAASVNAIDLLHHPVVREILSGAGQNTVLYFFWGKGSCEFLPFIDTAAFHKVFIRMHRYDLFEYVNNGYIPYRRALLQKASCVAPSSDTGRRHLQELYPAFEDKIKTFRLGVTVDGRQVNASRDRILRVVSCSLLSPVKRIHLMVECLQYIDFPILWRHIGDGTLRSDIEKLIKSCDAEEKFILEGMVSSEQVLDYYLSDRFDIFVNTSESEGIPVSIMEAMSVAMPVIATDVGGTGELVDDAVGALLKANPTSLELAKALRNFYQLPDSEKQTKRMSAFERCKKDYNAVTLGTQMAEFLKAPN